MRAKKLTSPTDRQRGYCDARAMRDQQDDEPEYLAGYAEGLEELERSRARFRESCTRDRARLAREDAERKARDQRPVVREPEYLGATV